jgi:aspartyl-tRNA(Asn)/glutamyl-tRNA(Gln) amidotransferase subunit A
MRAAKRKALQGRRRSDSLCDQGEAIMGFTSAAELGRRIAAGRVDPVELAEEYLARVGEADPDRQIYARLTPDRALAEAQAARNRARKGERLSPLDGVPVSWKDLFDTAGTATESGSLLLKGRVPDRDAKVLRHAAAAGAVCLGKTHQTELAFSGLGINPRTATPPNRAMPGHCPGGSSSGAAASLAFDLAPLAIGSDTGGSVRIPACWNNLVGLKTTHGALSNEGVVPLCPGFDTPGPLARSVEDAALAFTAMGGGNADLSAAPGLRSMHLLVVETIVLDDCDAPVREAFEAALDRLARAGTHIERAPLPELAEMAPLGPVLFPHDAWKEWGELIEAKGEIMYPPIRQRFSQGRNVGEADYLAAWEKLRELRRSFEARIAPFDAVLSPTVATLPPAVAPLLADADAFAAANLKALRNTRFFNMAGGCALTLPLPQTACGLQMALGAGKDVRLLQAGAAVEGVIGG